MGQVWQATDRVAEGIIMDTGLSEVGIAPACLEPGERASSHSHTLVDEINYITSGMGEIDIEGDTFPVCAGSVAVIPAGQFHELRNTGKENLEFVAVFNSNVDPKEVVLKDREAHFGSAKPGYLDLLNKIAAGECHGARGFNGWAAKTKDDNLRGVLKQIAIREAEHSAAFEKRLCELGHAVNWDDVDPALVKKLDYLETDATDWEKMQHMGYDRPAETDKLSALMRDPDIDPVTGALLGRFIAEERDSGRMMRACCQQLFGEKQPAAKSDEASVSLEEVCSAVTDLSGVVQELKAEIEALKKPASPKRRAPAKTRAKAKK